MADDATNFFRRNQVYHVERPISIQSQYLSRPPTVYTEVKFYHTFIGSNGIIYHIFGRPDGPDMAATATIAPSGSFQIDDKLVTRPRQHTFTERGRYYGERAAEIGIATGTRAQGPATRRGREPRNPEPPTILPRDVTRNIASMLGRGRRRKTQRAKNLR